ncbi:hypothetical protein [Pedobacter frigoris]|uniref:hypothetical protein n=1 Tax=Pedobacter frigoris TaxID=2571272 RepID=UPI00292EB643|nr:hypothetical protein [Pedobacter frigoris]
MVKFLKNKGHSKKVGTDSKGSISKAVACLISTIQTRWAAYMNKMTAGFSRRTQILILVLFTGITLFILIKPLTGIFSRSDPLILNTGSLHQPRLIIPERKAKDVSDQQLLELRQFKIYRDSLNDTANLNKVLERLPGVRPGLIERTPKDTTNMKTPKDGN